MNRSCLNCKQVLFRHLADKCNRSCKTQLSSGNASSSGKGSSGGSMACTCGNQTR